MTGKLDALPDEALRAKMEEYRTRETDARRYSNDLNRAYERACEEAELGENPWEAFASEITATDDEIETCRLLGDYIERKLRARLMAGGARRRRLAR